MRRRKVEVRAAALIAEEMTLRELRQARQLTQVTVARQLGISQDGVSRLEQRSDLLLSTLRRTVEAMGGSLSLIATFPDRPPVELSGISEREPCNWTAGGETSVRGGRFGSVVEPPILTLTIRTLKRPLRCARHEFVDCRLAKNGRPPRPWPQ